jgi:3-phenylpropionate/trans-cinnamate dioxygenase ferredoxin component
MTRYEAAIVEQVPTGEMISLTLGSAQVLIANIGGEFFALNDLCPHLAVPLSQGSLKGPCVVCPGHGSEFDLGTGDVIKWIGRKPGILGTLLSGKAQKAIRYSVTVQDGKVYVDI